jgi:putative FmdB family regulatory protein
MPIYEYQCAACGRTVEALQKISDPPLRKCPECKKLSLRRVVSAVAFRLKGAGWYETDFKGEGEKRRNLVEAGAPEAGESSTSADGAKEAVVDTPSKESEAKKPEQKAATPHATKRPSAAPTAKTKKRSIKPRAAKSARG